MSAVLLVLGFFLIYPILILLVNTFNTAGDLLTGSGEWGLDHWRTAFDDPRILQSLLNTLTIWGLTTGISFPLAVLIAWTLARTRIPFSHGLEFTFWLSYMMPDIATTVAWINLMDPDIGILNQLLEGLPFVERGPFNIFSVPGIVWAHLMANGISVKVMLLTPAFRNMDASLEEASRVSGATDIGTMMRVTLPLMISPMVLVFALQMLRIFQTFEIEQLLGVSFDYYVYSTLIFDLVRGTETPNYGQATVLASLTLATVAAIIPFQRWVLQRRHYTTVSSQFRPGLIDLGAWNYVAFAAIGLLLLILTLGPMLILVLGSFMSRVGYFEITPMFTLRHWEAVLSDNLFLGALKTTVTIATTAAILSPLLFSLLAYILVRTRWVGRDALDTIIWTSGAIPGMLAGLGLLLVFLDTPGLSLLYGTIWALLIVVILQGKTTGTNVMKGVFVQIGAEMEEASRIAGAGWVRTYFKIWLPLLMPTLVLLATMNFVIAANTTSSIILLASRDVVTLSILALELASPGIGAREQAGIVSLLIMAMTAGLALLARAFGLHLGVNTATVVRRRPKLMALLTKKVDSDGDPETSSVATAMRAVVSSRKVRNGGAMTTVNSRKALEKRGATDRSTVAVRLENVAKTYPGGTQAVQDVSFGVKDGELFSLLGASGCGKSTTLRLIAGLEVPDHGAVYLREQPVAIADQRLCLPPEKRRVGMVFQSYALWPHMTVEQNVGYPLRVRGLPSGEIRERVRAFLDLVGMRGMEDRPAPLLSGGQQQRVALARALVTEPDVLLLDEPFSSLDAKLRQQMRVEVKLIQKRLSIAVIFVTHDQVEALSISDRVALIDRGVIQQTGTPREVYEAPHNEFVRDFIGKTILFRGVVHESYPDGRMALTLEGSNRCEVFGQCYEPDPPRRGETAYLCVRPEDLEVLSANGPKAPNGALAGVVETALFTGEQVEYRVHIEEQGDFLVYGTRHSAIQEGHVVWLRPHSDGHTVWSKRQAVAS